MYIKTNIISSYLQAVFSNFCHGNYVMADFVPATIGGNNYDMCHVSPISRNAMFIWRILAGSHNAPSAIDNKHWWIESCYIHHNICIWKVARTSDKLVVTCFDMNGSSNVSRSLDFVNSIKHSHCFSISEISVALRIITFWHFICKKKTFSQTASITSAISLYKTGVCRNKL